MHSLPGRAAGEAEYCKKCAEKGAKKFIEKDLMDERTGWMRFTETEAGNRTRGEFI